MKSKAVFVLSVLLFSFVIFVSTPHAQEPTTSAAESAEKLRAQLLEVQAKEEDLKARAQQLDEALKPENIERSLAGIGSTKPEELRELRRRQLQIERDGVEAQLKLLETSRIRLEAAILNADTRAYQESAQGPPIQEGLVAQSSKSTAWLVSGAAGFAVVGLLTGVYMRRRLRRKL